MNALTLLIIINILLSIDQVFSTIDLNLSELKYLAIHLEPYECRQLVAALHYTSYELPRDIEGALRTINRDIPCLQHLFHWNNSPAEGRGRTHVDLEHRLRQLNRNDLANWLGKIVFKNLEKDLRRAIIDEPFEEQKQNERETQHPTRDESFDEPEDYNIWNVIDTFIIVLISFLITNLVVLMVVLIIHYCQRYFYEKKKQAKAINICGPNTCIRRQAVPEKASGKEREEDLDDEKKLLLYSDADAIAHINTSETDDQTDD